MAAQQSAYRLKIDRKFQIGDIGFAAAQEYAASKLQHGEASAWRNLGKIDLSGLMSAERESMNIFIFKSDATRGLRAFSREQGGHNLPAQFRPWYAVGVVKPGASPPNNLSRDVIEKSIATAGYQLWKLKDAKK